MKRFKQGWSGLAMALGLFASVANADEVVSSAAGGWFAVDTRTVKDTTWEGGAIVAGETNLVLQCSTSAWGAVDGGSDVTIAYSNTTTGNAGTIAEKTTADEVDWTPNGSGTFELTHTIATSGDPVVLTATFAVAAGAPTITDVTAQQRYPWNGKFDIAYTASGVDAYCQAQEKAVVLKVFAVDHATHVTNVAEAAYLSGDTTTTDGTHAFVWDMDAQDIFQDLVSTDFQVFVTIETQESVSGGVQLWADGPYWAESNVGATNPEDFGYQFFWGDTVGYKRNANDDGWVSADDGTALSGGFCAANCPTFSNGVRKSIETLMDEGYIDSTTNLVAAHDAATVYLGGPWRMPKSEETQALLDNCTVTWTTQGGIYGRLFTGKGEYVTKSIFMPAAGLGYNNALYWPGTDSGGNGDYWDSTAIKNNYGVNARHLTFRSDYIAHSYYEFRYGHSVRAVRAAGGSAGGETVCTDGSDIVRADLRTGEVRMAAATEELTYSPDWDGGTAVSIKVNGTEVFSGTDSGIYEWTPSGTGLFTLTHTTTTSGDPVVLTATFAVPVAAVISSDASTTNGYLTVSGAFAVAEPNDTVKLLDNVTENVTVAKDSVNTFDLAGFILEGTGSGPVVTVQSGATLTIVDSVPTTVHNYYVNDNGLWELTDLTKTVDYEDLTARPAAGDVVAVKGGAITGGSASGDGGGVYCYDCTVTLAGGNIIGNSASNMGGGVGLRYSELVQTAGRIIGNVGGSNGGGGVAVNGQHSRFTMNGGDIAYNAAQEGAGVSVGGTFIMTDGSIVGNLATSAYGYGGGVEEWGAGEGGLGTIITGGVISNNTAAAGGAGVYVWNAYGYVGGLTVGGDCLIDGNTVNDAANNVLLASGRTITVTNAPALTGAAKIGVTTKTKPTDSTSVAVTTAGTVDSSAYFASDDAKYYVGNTADNQVILLGYVSVVIPTVEHATVTNITVDGASVPVASPITVRQGVTIVVRYEADHGYILTGETSATLTDVDGEHKTIDVSGVTVEALIQVGDDAWARVTNGLCRVTGTTATWDFTNRENPLESYWRAITNIVVCDGVTGLGKYTFYKFYYATNITFAASVTALDEGSLFRCLSLEQVKFAGALPTMGENALNLHAGIRMEGDTPVIYPIPNVTVDGASLPLKGSNDLKNWESVSPGDEKKYHFFKYGN